MLSQTAAVLVFMNKFINSLLELLDKRYKLKCAANYSYRIFLNPIQDGHFGGCSQMGEGGFLPKICNTYSTMMKLGTVIPYLKIFKIYESRDTPLEFC